MKTLPPGKPRSREQTKAALNPRIEHWENHSFGLWAVIYKQNGEFIGDCGLQYLENTPEVELAYAIAKAYWHQGLTTEAAKAALK